MKAVADKKGRVDPRVPALAVGLLLALAAVAWSWRMNQAPRPADKSSAVRTTASFQSLSEEADQLMARVQARRAEDGAVLATDWPVVESPKPVALPAAAAKAAERTFRLRGVVRGGKHPAAFLDDKVLLVGEELEGYTLTGIAEDHVTLKDSRGREHQLFLEAGP